MQTASSVTPARACWLNSRLDTSTTACVTPAAAISASERASSGGDNGPSIGRTVFAAVPVAERIERAGRGAGRAKDRRQQPGDGRLAVRAGDADDFHLLRWIADQRLAQSAVRDAAVGHDELRHVEHGQRPLADHGGGAALGRVVGVSRGRRRRRR